MHYEVRGIKVTLHMANVLRVWFIDLFIFLF